MSVASSQGGRARELGALRVAALLGALALAGLTLGFDAPGVLIALLAVPTLLVLLIRPRAATLITLFLLYANVPVLAVRHAGLPVLVAAFVAVVVGWFDLFSRRSAA